MYSEWRTIAWYWSDFSLDEYKVSDRGRRNEEVRTVQRSFLESRRISQVTCLSFIIVTKSRRDAFIPSLPLLQLFVFSHFARCEVCSCVTTSDTLDLCLICKPVKCVKRATLLLLSTLSGQVCVVFLLLLLKLFKMVHEPDFGLFVEALC